MENELLKTLGVWLAFNVLCFLLLGITGIIVANIIVWRLSKE